MAYTEKDKARDMAYKKEHFDRIRIRLEPGEKEIFRAKAAAEGLSLAKWIYQLMEDAK